MKTAATALIAEPRRASRERQLRIFVLLVHGFGARSWAKNVDSRVCGIIDQLPYGYHRAADEGCTVEYSQDAKESALVSIIRLAGRRILGFDLLHAWRNRNGIFEADVIWTHTELEHLAVLLLLRVLPCESRPKLIAQSVWLYDRWEQFSRPKRWLYRKLLEQADLLTVLSPENQKLARRLFPHKRVEFVKFGIDSDSLTMPELRKSQTVVRLLALGRDMHRDWKTLISAVRGYEGCELRIGSNALNGEADGAENITVVTPKTPAEVAELYRWADIFILPLKPNFHASGITVLEESALFGVPVIATDTGGLRAYFSDDEVYYVKAGDSGALRAAIQRLAANRQLRYDMAKKAQGRLIQDDLTSRNYALRHRELSHDLIGQRCETRESGVRQ